MELIMSLQLVEKAAVPETLAMITDEEGEAMARAAVNLFRHWGITDAEACVLLGGVSKRTYARWKDGEIGRLTIDQKTRLSVLMGIHKDYSAAEAKVKKAMAFVEDRAKAEMTTLKGILSA